MTPKAMFRILDRLFRRHPPGFPHAIEARFDQTLFYEGSVRTGADLFDGTAGRPLAPLIYHQFVFDRGARAYCFKIRDDERAMRFVPGERQRAYLDDAGHNVRFREREGRAFPVTEPDADEDEA